MADTALLDRLTRRQVLIQRFAGQQIRQAMPVIRQLARDLRARIAAGDATEFGMGRMVELERDIQALVAAASDGMQAALDLEDFAIEEARFAQTLLGAHVSASLAEGLNVDLIRAISTRRQLQLVSGDTIKRMTIPQLFEEFSEAASRDALRAVQAGVLEGKTQQQMARDVVSLVETRSRRQAGAVVRTAVNGIGTAAREQVYRDNADVLEGERWISVIDGRTSLVCMGRDREVYPVGSGPTPPAHYNCRSVRVPIVRQEFRIGVQGERASMDGPIDARTTYGGWLKRQPKAFQDDALGPKRAELFRSGKVSIDQFTDNQGRVLTLEDLRNRYDIVLE